MSGFIRNDHGNQWGGAEDEGEGPTPEQVVVDTFRKRLDAIIYKLHALGLDRRPGSIRKIGTAIGRIEKEVAALQRLRG